MIGTRFTLLTEKFVICSCQNHQKFPLWVRLCQYDFCNKPLLFLSSSRYHNSGPSESACRNCAYPNPVPLLLATPLEVQQMTWKCLDSSALGLPEALKDYVHRTNSTKIPVVNPAIHVINRFVLLRVLRFDFHFRFLLACAAGLTEAPRSYCHFFRGTVFSAH